MNTERQAERNDAVFDALTDICERPREVAIWAEDLPTLPGFSFYDEGWNARCRNERYHPLSSRAWRDGWKDCNEASSEDRVMR